MALSGHSGPVLRFYGTVIAIVRIMWINKLHELWLHIIGRRPRICHLRIHLAACIQHSCLMYLIVVLLDKAVTGLKATGQVADVHKFLLVEHLNNAFENSLVEFFDVE